MTVSKQMKYILLVIALAFIPGLVYAQNAELSIRGTYNASSSEDSVSHVSQPVTYMGYVRLSNTGSIPALPNVTVTLLTDNITRVDYARYAIWDRNSAVWTYPPNFTITSSHNSNWVSDTNPVINVPFTFSRTVNQTVFSQDGYQRVQCNVTFWDTAGVYATWGSVDNYKRDKVNVTILNDTFETDLPHWKVMWQNSKQYQISLNDTSELIIGHPYTWSVVLKIERIDPTKTVVYKPLCTINLITTIGLKDVAGTTPSFSIPEEELPPYVHQASASLGVPVNWSYWSHSMRSAQLLENSGYDQSGVPDHRSRIGVVRNSNTWLLDASGNGAYGGGDLAYVFGKAGDAFITGDWNADNRTEIGVVRNSNTWLLDASGNGAYGGGDLAYVFGKAGDAFITGDWNADNRTEIGVVRNSNTWLLDASGNGAYGGSDLAYVFGKAGDVYITGDWNNDGRSEIGVVRNNNTWLLDASGNGAYGAGDLTYVFGKAGDIYITGDWNNDGRSEIGVVRNNNTWLLDASGNGAYGGGDLTYVFGKAGDKYVTGKWN